MPIVFGDGDSLSNMVRIDTGKIVRNQLQIIDGTSNTIMFLEYPDGKKWMEAKPVGIDDAVNLVTGLKDGESLIAFFYDLSYCYLDNTIDEQLLRNLLDPNDGNNAKIAKGKLIPFDVPLD